jgi:DNA adenine methylase
MIKTPLRYFGRKRCVVETIARLLPDFDVFQEPFLGGGLVFMNVKQRFPRGDVFTHTIKQLQYDEC